MAITAQNARDALSRYKKDITDVDSPTFIEWCNYAARQAYNFVIGIDSERFITTNSYASITSGSQALPADFKNVQPDGCGFFPNNTDGTAGETPLTRTNYGSQKMGYYITGGNVVFTGINTATTVVLRYIPKLTALTALGDYFTVDSLIAGIEIIEDEHLEYLVKDLDTFYTQWDEEPGAESLADFRFVRLLNALADTFKQDSAVYGLPDYTLNF